MSSPPREPIAASRPEEFVHLVEAVQDYAIFLLGPGGEIRSWNRGAERISGYREDEVIGRHFSLLYGPADLAAAKPARELEAALRDGRIEDEGWRLRKDGTGFWANTVITLLRNGDGTVRGFAKVTRDMTERREIDEKLRQSGEIFELLVSSVRDYAIFMLDPDGRVVTWNVGAERIKGYAPHEIIGRHFSTFYSEEDVRNGKPRHELAIAREKGSVEDEGWRVRKDGSRFWANVVITAVFDARGSLRGFGKVTRDMTERKRTDGTQRVLLEQREAALRCAEEERRRAEVSCALAREANRVKDEFLVTLSHELRTPLTSILGWARMLPTISSDDPLFREATGSIRESARLQARLIDDLLDISRIVSGKLRFAPEAVEVSRLVMDAVDAVTPTASAKQIALTTSLAPDVGAILADRARMQQVIWNLLSNAVKFTPPNGAVRISARLAAPSVLIAVNDNGEGIDPEFLPHIFDPFRQADTAQTRVHGGLGLGLSIVRHLAEAHGGSITAESDGRGHGATFTLTLPVHAVPADAHAVTHNVDEEFPHRDRLHGLHIVVADDDPEARKVVCAVLRAAGATVVAFDSASTALEEIDRRQPTAVITDIAMPEIDGYMFVRALRSRSNAGAIRVIALTALPAPTEALSTFDLYLCKPIDPFHLVDEIARLALRATPAA